MEPINRTMSSAPSSWANRLLNRLAAGLLARPTWFVIPQIVLFGLCVVYTVRNLQFDMDRNSLVGRDKVYHRNFLKFREEFPSQDDIVVVVESEDREKNRQFIERLGRILENETVDMNATNLFSDVFYKGDLRLMGNKALLFFPEEDLADFQEALKEFHPFLNEFRHATNLSAVFRQVNTLIRTGARQREDEASQEAFIQAIPAMDRLVRMARASLQRPGIPPSPGVEALFGGGAEAEQQKYVTFSGGRLYLLSAKPRLVEDPDPIRRHAQQEAVTSDAIRRVRALVAEIQEQVPGLNVGVTGEQVLDHDEMVQSQKDSIFASILALTLCVLLFVVAYRETGRPLKAIASLVIGLGYTLGYTTLVVGHLNILTVTFVPMLVGLAIDFGVHLVTRYEEELRSGHDRQSSIRIALVQTGQGIFTGCLTTSGAFFAMSLTEFKGIEEMGIITGGGMLLCLIPMLTVLPVLLLRGKRQNAMDMRAAAARVGFNAERRARLEKYWLNHPWKVVGIATVLAGLALSQAPKVYFDYNLLNMQSHGLPSVEFEHKLIQGAEKSVLYAAMVAESLEEAVELEAQILKLPTVSSTDSMVRFLTEDADNKLRMIRDLKASIASIRFDPIDPNPVDLHDLSRRLFSLQGYLALAGDELKDSEDPDLQRLHAQLKSLREGLMELRVALFRGNQEANARQLAAFQRAFLSDLHETIRALQTQDASEPLTIDDLPTPLRNRFVGRTGQHLIQVYPRTNIWEREPQEAFLLELRSIDAFVTGTPVQLYEYTSLLKDAYVEAAWWALGAIILLVFIHFRSLPQVFLALLPVAIGTLWLVGWMGWRDQPFNPANIMTLPLVIGIGVTNGIHILNRFAEERDPSILGRSTGKAVLISALTTMAGFGSLMTGEHQGIQSLGWVMSTGAAFCMIAGLTVLPSLLTLMARRQTNTAHPKESDSEDLP